MNVRLPDLKIDRARATKAGVWSSIAALHVGLFLMLGLVGQGSVPASVAPTMLITLEPPLRVPRVEPPKVAPAAAAGGGAPAAPSRVRPPVTPPQRPVEVLAPLTPAPTQPLVVGSAALATPTPGPGQGGEGDGTGDGVGDGEGPGRGGTPPLILRGPTPAEILGVVPPEARRARQAGRASINCVIRLDQRLDDCRVVSETPSGYRFGEAGLRAATFFRYRPPMTSTGRPIEGQRATITVMFGRQ